MSTYFDIRVFYKTGDSFRSYETDDLLDIPMASLEIAKENLQRIKEHHKVYEKRESYWSKKEDIVYPEYYIRKREGRQEPYDWNGIKLRVDENTERELLSPFWIGYFERLLGAEIVAFGKEHELSFRV